ncbi:hypothetical protein IKA92_07415 [bacterium]|nr:hypothetical protein [bacterium]MBR2387105.1 hypothetical protein [bacterium]
MRECKSCGGSLTKVGTAPFDNKLCYVCYLAKQNNKNIDRIEKLEKELEVANNSAEFYRTTHRYRFYLSEDKVQDFHITDEMFNTFENKGTQKAIAKLKEVLGFIDSSEGNHYPAPYQIKQFINEAIEKLEKEIKKVCYETQNENC